MKLGFRLGLILSFLWVSFAQAQTSQTRAQLENYATTTYTANGVGAITGPDLQVGALNQAASTVTLLDTAPVTCGTYLSCSGTWPSLLLGSSPAPSTIAIPQTVTGGVSGGLAYFSSTTALASSSLLAANAIVVGGGAGAAPSTVTTNSSALTALGNAPNASGGIVTYSGALGTITSGNLLNGTGYLPSNLATGTLASGVTVPVANLASSSTTVNGTTCTLGSTCTVSTGTGTVTSVGGSFTGGLISISGSPVTVSGTLAFTVAGTSGGIPYFSSSSGWASSAALTANAPVIGGGAGAAPTVGSRSGHTTVFGTVNGTLISGHCVSIDANLNLQDAGGACTTGGGGGTVNSGTSGQLTYYGSTGTAVSGNANFTISAGVLTHGIAGSVQGGIVLAGSSSGSTTITAVTSGGGTITLPASGTLATTAVATLSSLTSIGTIATGVWQGTAIATAYGGTGLSGGTPFTSGGAFYATSTSAMTTGTLPVTAGGTGVTTSTGSGNVVLSSSPTLVTPALGAATATSLVASAGLVSTSSYGGSFSGGIAVDHASGLGRISLGPSDGLTIYNGGIASTAIWQLSQYGRVTPRIITTASGSTITPTSDTADQYTVTALATGATIAAPSGSPVDGQKLIIRFKDAGTAEALTWTTTSGAFRAIGVTLPTTTVISKALYVGAIYNAQDSYWDVVAVQEQ